MAGGSASGGSIDRSSITVKNGSGPPQKTISSRLGRTIYANFYIKRPFRIGLPLTIEWIDPNGDVRARWRNKTAKTDVKGTRLYAYVTPALYRNHLGRWTARFSVNSVVKSQHRFTLT